MLHLRFQTHSLRVHDIQLPPTLFRSPVIRGCHLHSQNSLEYLFPCLFNQSKLILRHKVQTCSSERKLVSCISPIIYSHKSYKVFTSLYWVEIIEHCLTLFHTVFYYPVNGRTHFSRLPESIVIVILTYCYTYCIRVSTVHFHDCFI